MAHILEDRVLESSTSTGSGDITLAGAVTGFRRFSAVCAVNDTVPYFIEAVDSLGAPSGDYEYGIGTYSAANTLTRTAVLGSSNAGAAVVFAAGSKNVGIGLNKREVVRAGEAGLRNKIINGGFDINQRVVSGAVVLAAGAYGHDRWKAGAAGCSYTFASSGGVTTMTITAGSLQQVVEGKSLQSGTHVLSWGGTAQGKIDGGAYAGSGVAGTATGGTNMTVEFGTGTLEQVQLNAGTIPLPFEQRPFGLELLLCQRYYEKSYDYATAPGTATENGAVTFRAPSANPAQTIQFKVRKRVIPTLQAFNTATGASGSWRDDTAAANLGTATLATGEASVAIEVTTSTGNRIKGHWTASAEL